ncbi:hypothetical protein SAMN05421688_0868 [Poseidonocella pacifica]|uniref:Right handed beta helix region n=1 Tax=Poseidonocella pacifica TaxID=871651 RepID=A0A1I0VQ18_9RHOB|nr:DUF6519 domain-containing protein [Poseidonocella pacifica]SFA78529.1 hypothetical protein SAMN05421688_0868 [Poseidonocella pacifica]
MKGDFSQNRFRAADNYTGTLYQQGRAFSDQDGNSADAIGRNLRQTLGRDTIGPGVVAVPQEAPDSLRILQADSDGNQVTLQLEPGRVWLDGLHLLVPGPGPLDRMATYFGPPIDSPAPTAGEIAAGVRDAVVLECWEEAMSAFQDPEALLEPALGGPDTTERVALRHRLRLLRLQDDEDCANLDRMDNDLDAQGHLTVTPAPTAVIAGDCPVQAGGGFTGFEHFFYRIEIATPDGIGNARFKYSRFNGGLVGRGTFDNVTNEIAIRANALMISLSQLSDFWVEVLAPGPAEDPGQWHSVLTADATLAGSDRLSLSNISGAWPGLPADEAFFRLWDGVRLIQDFPTGLATPNELELGIRLAFDAANVDGGNYRPGDFWTFPARAAGVDFDPATWPNDAAPEGIVYHRAPLGVLNWNAGPVVTLNGPPEIHDCRAVFPPLTRIQSCCTYSVGDGHSSHGDFDTIQAAVDALPPDGGEVCVLPGTYAETVVIDKDNVHIHGCGPRSRVIANSVAPVFDVTGHSGAHIERLFISADDDGMGILVQEDAQGVAPRDILLADLTIEAGRDSAVKVLGARGVKLLRSAVTMRDLHGPWHAVYLRCEDGLVEHNTITVAPTRRGDDVAPPIVAAGRGGMHLAGTCMHVEVIDNLVVGGIGHGITLGSIVEIGADGGGVSRDPGWIVNRDDPCDPCRPGDTNIPPRDDPDDPRFQSAGALYDIRIERNRISRMGLSGIGVIGFFDLAEEDEFISVVGLDILGNRIEHCLARELVEIAQGMRPYSGYGAVALADVEDLRFFDNVLENNGPTDRFAITGLFVLHGAALEIHRNRILNNGAKAPQGAEAADEGQRGGIVIRFAVPGIEPLNIEGDIFPRQDGRPAARIHDNVVSQPLGQALSIQALGPVSVTGNALSTRGLLPRPLDPSFWASAVWILNLGWSNEFYLQFLLFTGVTAAPIEPGSLPEGGDDLLPRPRPGLDDFGFGSYLASGNVLFNDNQVVTDLTETAASFAVSSVLIVSMDDVTVQDNQLDCDFYLDFMFTNLLAVGMTLRINNNRLKESLFVTLYSSVGLGWIFNNTSDNQATHCILSLNSPLGVWIPFISPSIVERDNRELFHNINFLDGWCERLDALDDILMPDRSGNTPGVNSTFSNTFGFGK